MTDELIEWDMLRASLARLEEMQLETQAMISGLLDMLAQDAQEEPQAFDLSGRPLPRERGENTPL